MTEDFEEADEHTWTHTNGQEASVPSNFEQMLVQLDKADLMPVPQLIKPSSELIEDKAVNNLVISKQLSNDRATADSSKQVGNKRHRGHHKKNVASKDER